MSLKLSATAEAQRAVAANPKLAPVVRKLDTIVKDSKITRAEDLAGIAKLAPHLGKSGVDSGIDQVMLGIRRLAPLLKSDHSAIVELAKASRAFPLGNGHGPVLTRPQYVMEGLDLAPKAFAQTIDHLLEGATPAGTDSTRDPDITTKLFKRGEEGLVLTTNRKTGTQYLKVHPGGLPRDGLDFPARMFKAPIDADAKISEATIWGDGGNVTLQNDGEGKVGHYSFFFSRDDEKQRIDVKVSVNKAGQHQATAFGMVRGSTFNELGMEVTVDGPVRLE